MDDPCIQSNQRQPLVTFDPFIAKSAVKSFVPGIVKDAEHAVLYSRPASRSREGFKFLRCLLADFHPLHIGGQRLGHLLTSGLYGEIFLRFSDFRFARIAVLGDQITGKTGKLVVFDFSYGSRSDFDHFAGAGKMVLWVISRLLA